MRFSVDIYVNANVKYLAKETGNIWRSMIMNAVQSRFHVVIYFYVIS